MSCLQAELLELRQTTARQLQELQQREHRSNMVEVWQDAATGKHIHAHISVPSTAGRPGDPAFVRCSYRLAQTLDSLLVECGEPELVADRLAFTTHGRGTHLQLLLKAKPALKTPLDGSTPRHCSSCTTHSCCRRLRAYCMRRLSCLSLARIKTSE